VYLCVFYGYQNKQRLFPYTTLTDWFYNRENVCLQRGTGLVFKCNSDQPLFLNGRGMTQAAIRRVLIAEAQVRSHGIAREFCGGQSIGTGFSPSTSVFPCQYHSNNASYSSSPTRLYYHKDERAKTSKHSELKSSFENPGTKGWKSTSAFSF
jgi:hypothetical protein